MELVAPTPDCPAVVFGEAMIELSDVTDEACRLGVAGDSFNTAVYLSRQGLSVAYMTALGDEAFSDRIAGALTEEGIDTRYVLRRDGGTAGLYAVTVDEVGERSFTYWRSASAARAFFRTQGADDVLRKAERTPLLYLSGITLSLFDESERRQVISFARAVREVGGAVVFDTNYRPRGWESSGEAARTIDALAPHVSIALPTFDDEAILFGFSEPIDSADRWLAAGAREVVVKHGPAGALIAGKGWVPPPETVLPLDTTGAGDSFNAGYLAARLGGAPPKEAAMAGHVLAAKVLRTPGAILPRGGTGPA
ncbi:sugar kinase [Parvularcula dongshanensis]|uniref:2-dehydro-3-deoxygluconokinase n=1 Tax=Parvularcula dongshanensis TaxID=1173995 RepID=A0A840I537_9PROT|nr:sugar kinase [Parvularcula dongshanensis]MBB4659445.1 2-dehydro-3-deoxygluconokinase [Parvularcula dongshanensis]